jgi:hypothetical protein
LLPFGTSITTNAFSFYTVKAADILLPGPPPGTLPDTASLAWNNTCTAPNVQNCTTGAQSASAGSSTLVQRIASSTATQIHNEAHQVVTVVGTGTTVHDFVTVTGQPGQPTPSGNVTIAWFLNGNCSGNAAASATVALNASGQVDATGFAFTVNSAAQRAFRATYLGDSTYNASTGACEPLQVVDANIQITPQTATNPINTDHTLTVHVNVNDGLGGGPVPAPAGTLVAATKVSGPGSFVGPNTCTTVGTTGDCTIVITSGTTGTTVINASTDVTVAGVSLHRSTGDGLPLDSPNASKTWVAAAITIAPSAINEVGHAHTFTVTVTQDLGNGTFVPAPGANVTVTCTAGNGATPTPPNPPSGTTNAAGQFTFTVNSPTAGTDTCHASATLTVGGAGPVTVQTNGVAPNSGDAVKTFVDANIQITPQQATNPVNTNHTLTGHVNVNAGNGAGFVNAPDGTVINFSLTNSNGASAAFVGPSNCTTSGGTGSCTVVINSATGGSTSIHATTTLSVAGVSLTRATGDGLAGDSADATKNWAAARISIAPSATNEVNHAHTFTVTLEKDTGGGFAPAAGETVTVACTAGNGATPTAPSPASGTTNGSGQFTFTVNSPTAGTDTCNATSTLNINGVSITVATNGSGGSGPATKTWVDANIQITPQQANNPTGTNHTLTGHVNVNAGNGAGFVNAPDGTVISFSLTNSGGATAVFVGPSTCTTSGGSGSCTVVISSPTPGSTSIHASTTVSVGGVSLTRATGDGLPGDSPNATKTWTGSVVTTRVLNASNSEITNQTVPAGTVVHDEATVANAAGTPAGVPAPTGTVTFTLYNNGTCNGTVLATDSNVALNASGVATSSNFTTPATAGSFSYLAHYNGDANHPAVDGPCEPFRTLAQPKGIIAPTQTTCNDVLTGTAETLAQVNYPVVGGKIGQGINPGVFFFYSQITTTVPNQVVTVSQSNTSTNNAANFQILQGQAWLWSGDCSSKIVGETTNGDTGATFVVPTPGNYIIGIKYTTKSIAGTTAPVPADITYNFTTSLGGQTGASVLLHRT